MCCVFSQRADPNAHTTEAGTADDLNIKSEDLRKYFQKHKIVPHQHDKYKHYFSRTPPNIALTYEWKATFRELRAFLSPANIRRHNRTALDPNPSLWHRLYLMSFLWVFLGPLALIPEDVDERTMFIDIMANDQNSIDMRRELASAERQYEGARWHVIAATSSVLERAWCLYEIAVRRGAGGRSQLVVAGGEEGAGIVQQEVCTVGALGLLKMIAARVVLTFCLSFYIGGAFLKALWGINVFKAGTADSASASVLAVGKDASFFSRMQASVAADVDVIRDKALEVFRSEIAFNGTVMSATVRYGGGRLELGLLLWLEAGLALAMLPAHAASAALSLVAAGGWALGHLCLRLCGRRLYFGDEDVDFITKSGMSRLGASVFLVWVMSDSLIKLPLLAAVFAAVAPPWAAAAALLLSPGLCCCCLCVWRAAEAEGGGGDPDAGQGRGWEMAAVLGLALSAPVLAPFVALAVLFLLYAISLAALAAVLFMLLAVFVIFPMEFYKAWRQTGGAEATMAAETSVGDGADAAGVYAAVGAPVDLSGVADQRGLSHQRLPCFSYFLSFSFLCLCPSP